jgi:hypothetical protein
LESKFLNNRIGIDLSWYNRKAEDQIIERPLDLLPVTVGFPQCRNCTTKERSVYHQSLSTKNINWNLRPTFKNVSKVVDLPEGSEEILLITWDHCNQSQPLV